MARTPFKLRSQGQPFKMVGAMQPAQPAQPAQPQPPVQPIVQNSNDPQVQQQIKPAGTTSLVQRAPLMQVAGPGDQEELTTTYDPNAPVDKTKKKSKLGGILKGIGLGAVDMLTAGLDRVYSTGKTNTLGGSKALTFAKTKAELAEQALKDKKDTNKPITELVETSDSKVDNAVIKEEEKK